MSKKRVRSKRKQVLIEVPFDDRKEYYSMQDIAHMTMRTTATLFRMIRAKKLNKAEHVLPNGKTRLWKRDYIHAWIDSEPFARKNPSQKTLDAKQQLIKNLERQFALGEMEILERASAALLCDPSFFIWDAAIHKAERVLELKANTPSVYARW